MLRFFVYFEFNHKNAIRHFFHIFNSILLLFLFFCSVSVSHAHHKSRQSKRNDAFSCFSFCFFCVFFRLKNVHWKHACCNRCSMFHEIRNRYSILLTSNNIHCDIATVFLTFHFRIVNVCISMITNSQGKIDCCTHKKVIKFPFFMRLPLSVLSGRFNGFCKWCFWNSR